MKKKLLVLVISAIILSGLFLSCKADDLTVKKTPNFDAGIITGTLNDTADFPVYHK